MHTFTATQLFDGQCMHHNMVVDVEDGYITNIAKASENTGATHLKHNNVTHLTGMVCPGFVDTQVNGGGGELFNYNQSPQALQAIFQAHAQFGTTSLLPTIITSSYQIMENAANAVAQAIAQGNKGIVGVHFEGPFLSQIKKGIHPANHVRGIADKELSIFTRKDIGKVMVTIAPENVPCDVIKDLVQQNVVVSLGHSGATIDQALAAIDAGATGYTHLFNAMSGLSAREPGMIGAALSDPRVMSGLIGDLHHVHPHNCKLAYQCIGANRLMLVTDAMAQVGSQVDTLPWEGGVISRKGSKLTLENGDLAGSCLDMGSAVRNMCQLLNNTSNAQHIQEHLPDVLTMASRTPARFLGISDIGELQLGKKANFAVLSDTLQIDSTWLEGMQIERVGFV